MKKDTDIIERVITFRTPPDAVNTVPDIVNSRKLL